MKNFIKKSLVISICALFLFGLASGVKAGWVNGYYRSNGTYVSSYYRSSPNALRYDNYSYKPSQPLYNSSYYTPTRNYSSSWYTPSYYSDSSYYFGKSLYQSRNSYSWYNY